MQQVLQHHAPLVPAGFCARAGHDECSPFLGNLPAPKHASPNPQPTAVLRVRRTCWPGWVRAFFFRELAGPKASKPLSLSQLLARWTCMRFPQKASLPGIPRDEDMLSTEEPSPPGLEGLEAAHVGERAEDGSDREAHEAGPDPGRARHARVHKVVDANACMRHL